MVKAIQIDNIADNSFVRDLSSAYTEIERFRGFFDKKIRYQLKVDNGMFLRLAIFAFILKLGVHDTQQI